MKKALTALAVVTAVVLVGAAVLPHKVRVQRSRAMSAPPERMAPLLSDLRRGWPQWSPFGKAHDSALQESFSGPESGAGATENWTGGSMPPGHLTLTRADGGGVDFRIEMQGGVDVAGSIALSTGRATWTDEVDLGSGLMAGWSAVLLRFLLGSSIDDALEQLDRAAQPR